jgi:hypothetical protein
MMNARSALSGLKHQKEKRNMDYFAGLDVSVKETSICIVDDTGKIVREARVASEPEALLQVLANTIYRFKRVGLEAGPLSQWLYSILVYIDETMRGDACIPFRRKKTFPVIARSSKALDERIRAKWAKDLPPQRQWRTCSYLPPYAGRRV